MDQRETDEMPTEIAERIADERTNGRLENGDEIDDVAELHEDQTEDVDGTAAVTGCGRAEKGLDQRSVDEAEQREIELREKDGDAYPDARQSIQRREQRPFQLSGYAVVDIRFLHRKEEDADVLHDA